MKLKYIVFIFKDGEHIRIDEADIGVFYIDNLYDKNERANYSLIDSIITAHTLGIEIWEEANKDIQFKNCVMKAFDKIMCSDIVAIEFPLYEGENDIPYSRRRIEFYKYNVIYDANDNGKNKYQTTYISKQNHLYITISDKFKFESLFNKDEIDNPEIISHYREVCKQDEQMMRCGHRMENHPIDDSIDREISIFIDEVCNPFQVNNSTLQTDNQLLYASSWKERQKKAKKN